MRRIVISGIGMVSPLGNNLNSSWKALIQGKSGIQLLKNDPVLKNINAYNLSMVKNFDFKRWRVPVKI